MTTKFYTEATEKMKAIREDIQEIITPTPKEETQVRGLTEKPWYANLKRSN